MFLYALNHLVGFENFTIDQLKGYGAPKVGGYETVCHGHSEIEVPDVEVTTGPLGQGVANAVGLAIASKSLAARYNEPGFDVVKSRVYCMTGDSCLMEGVALEAISLARHLKLDNLGKLVFLTYISYLSHDNDASYSSSTLRWVHIDSKLVLIYDNNAVTCDGPLEWINSEDVNFKMKASGWNVLDVTDGSYDVQLLADTLRKSSNY